MTQLVQVDFVAAKNTSFTLSLQFAGTCSISLLTQVISFVAVSTDHSLCSPAQHGKMSLVSRHS
jgi:hypothetical protein